MSSKKPNSVINSYIPNPLRLHKWVILDPLEHRQAMYVNNVIRIARESAEDNLFGKIFPELLMIHECI